MRDEASELDKALSAGNGDRGTDPLVDVARELQATYDAPASSASRERALFVEGIAAQHPRRSWLLLAAPATVLGGIFILFLALAGRALPGDSLYSVRKVMGSVGLARPAATDIRDVLEEASRSVTSARLHADATPARARREAVFALGRLGVARELLSDVRNGSRAVLLVEIEKVERQATAALWLASEEAEFLEERAERIEERREEREEAAEDNSGPGSGDGGGSDDDDNSGSGSGDDDGTDSSGSGSGDGSSGDNSGSGSGSGDSSGSGSGDD